MKTEIVTKLKREATRILADLHETQEPVLITEHGKPSAYLIDVDYYEMLQVRIQILEGIARGERAILEKNILSNIQAKEAMIKWLN